MGKLLCFGHRGAAGHAPENTLLAVETGISLGADWIEIDVYAVEDELVVIHDDRLERTTNGSGYVMEKSLHYLRALDAGKGEKIPLLREVFELVDRRVGINVELKGPGTALPVSELIDFYVQHCGWQYNQFIVSSFDHRELQKIQSLQPHIPIGFLIYGRPLHFLQSVRNFSAFSLHTSQDFIDQELVTEAHQLGLKVFVYTVNHVYELNRLVSLGIDGVFSDFPDKIIENR